MRVALCNGARAPQICRLMLKRDAPSTAHTSITRTQRGPRQVHCVDCFLAFKAMMERFNHASFNKCGRSDFRRALDRNRIFSTHAIDRARHIASAHCKVHGAIHRDRISQRQWSSCDKWLDAKVRTRCVNALVCWPRSPHRAEGPVKKEHAIVVRRREHQARAAEHACW